MTQELNQGGSAVERARAEFERQMEAQDFDLPASLQRDAGRVWLEGWFDLNAALPTMSADYVMVPREVLVRARNLAMDRTVRAPIPECANFGAIAQDLDAMLYSAPFTGGE